MKTALASVVILLAALAATVTAQPPSSQPPSPSQPPAEIRFRRIFIPEGTKDLPRGDVKYLPMESREFERLLGSIQRTSPGLPAQSTVGLLQAQYECRMKSPTLLEGSATLDFSPAIASSMLMTLDPCNLAIDHAQWVTSDGAPAVLGMSGDGRLQVLAEPAGQMKFDWSLAGRQDAAEVGTFAIGLPPCSVSRLLVDLPADLAPAVDRGVVSDEGTADPGSRRWKIELGGWPGCRLRVVKKENAPARREVVLGRLSTVYDLSLRGVEVTSELEIDAHREPLTKIALDLEPPLELVEASEGGQALSWNMAANRGGKSPQAVVDLPPHAQVGGRRLRFRAVAPLPRAEAWKPPRILADGVVCRTSAVSLKVSSPLCIANLSPHGCRQTGISALKPAGGEQLDFESFDADAGMELSLIQRPTDVQAVCATATIFGQGKMSSRVTADLHTAQGPLFTLEADVLPRWTIDSVESQPADALDDWTLENRGGKPKLSIRLARPLTSERPLRLIVSARRLYAFPGRNLDIDDVAPLRFSPPVASQRLVDLRATGANELRVKAGAEACRADVNELTAAQLDLFPEQPGELLLRDDATAAGLRLSLERRKPTFDAVIRGEAVLGGRLLEENYTLLCSPAKAAPMDRLVVHFSGRRAAALKWSILGLDESRYTASRWTASQDSAAGLAAGEEAWDVVFRNPQSTPIELHVTRTTAIDGPLPLSLVSLPDAATQEAALVVRSLGPEAVEIKTRRLTSLPVDSVPAGKIQTVRGSFRYDPRAETTPQAEPAIVVTPVDNPLPAAWVWDCGIASQYAADGAAEHVITYRLENAGRRQIDLALPPPLARRDVHGIWINKKPAPAISGDPAASVVTVDLPLDVKTIDLVVRLATRGAPLAAFSRLSPPLPQIGLPVFAQHWSAELPPGYATLLAPPGESAAAAESGFRDRLLGGLARGEGERVFDPLRASDWRNLLRASAAEPADALGRPRFSMPLDDRASSTIVIYRPTFGVAGWLLFLMIVAIGTWRRTGRAAVLFMLAVVCGSGALLLPEAISAIFARGLLGVMFCLLAVLVRRLTTSSPAFVQPPRAKSEMPSTLTNVIPFAAPLLAAAILLVASSAKGQETPPSAAADYSVYIPVNEKQQPTGGKYLVPEAFFSELYRRASKHVEKPQGWLISSAVYRASLAENASMQGHVVDRLTAEYEIRVFNAGVRVQLPLRRDEVSLVPGRAQLDDRPVQPDWDANGGALLLDVAEPGEYRFEVALRPRAQPDSSGGGFEMAIPRVPGARLEVSEPMGGPAVEVPSALGAVRWEDIPSRWIAELGPADRLAVRWQDGAAAAAEPVNVEQLQWLRIEPGCVLLDVRLKSTTALGPPRRLQIKADPALELLGDSAASARAVAAHGDETAQTIDVEWPPSSGAAAVLDLHFLCAGAASIGTFHTPQIDVVGARPGRRWLAVSIDRSLECQLPGGRNQEAGAVPEFLGNWGTGAAAPPDFAFHLNDRAAEWSLTTRPRKPEVNGDQTVVWTFDADGAQLQFNAQLTAAAGNVFQWRINAPPELHIDSVAASIEGSKCNVRWSQDKDGRITAFPDAAVTGHHTLSVAGRMPLAAQRKFPLPQIRLEDVRVQGSVLRLRRRASVQVDVFAPPGLAEVKSPPDDSLHAEQADLLRSFYVDPAEVNPVSVTIQPSRLQPSTEVAAPRPSATPHEQTLPGDMRVARAEFRLAWQPDGRSLGAATFDIDAPAAGDIPLTLPGGFELLHLTIDGVPSDAAKGEKGDWIVTLSPHAATSRVEALYFADSARSSGPAGGSRAGLQAPRLGNVPVKSITWFIAVPSGLRVDAAVPAAMSDDQASDLAKQWRDFAKTCGNVMACASDGQAGSPAISFSAIHGQSWPGRLEDLIGFLAAVALIAFLLRRGLLWNWLVHWPYLFGVGLGLAWWLWASPSAIGLVIVAAVLARQFLGGKRFGGSDAALVAGR